MIKQVRLLFKPMVRYYKQEHVLFLENQFCIVRYNVDGSIDSTFGTNGYFIYQVPGTTSNTLGRSIVIQSDGKILLGGTCDNKFCIVRIQ
jgi:hypothetical protein